MCTVIFVKYLNISSKIKINYIKCRIDYIIRLLRYSSILTTSRSFFLKKITTLKYIHNFEFLQEYPPYFSKITKHSNKKNCPKAAKPSSNTLIINNNCTYNTKNNRQIFFSKEIHSN